MSADLNEWRRSLYQWLSDNPCPPYGDDDHELGLIRNWVLIYEGYPTDGHPGPMLAHLSGDATAEGGLPTWIEEGILRSALHDVRQRILDRDG